MDIVVSRNISVTYINSTVLVSQYFYQASPFTLQTNHLSKFAINISEEAEPQLLKKHIEITYAHRNKREVTRPNPPYRRIL